MLDGFIIDCSNVIIAVFAAFPLPDLANTGRLIATACSKPFFFSLVHKNYDPTQIQAVFYGSPAAYLKPCQASIMELLRKIVKVF